MGTKVKEIFKYKGKHILYNTGKIEQEEEKEVVQEVVQEVVKGDECDGNETDTRGTEKT